MSKNDATMCKKCGSKGATFNPRLCIDYDIMYGPSDVLIHVDTEMCGKCMKEGE